MPLFTQFQALTNKSTNVVKNENTDQFPFKIKQYLKTTVAISSLAVSMMATSVFADNDRFKGVKISSQKLTENVYLFTGSGGNIGVSTGEDGVLIIDAQFAPLADKISAQLDAVHQQTPKTSHSSSKPKYVINTHHHGDHTGGNVHFGQSSTILTHHNVLKRLSANSDIPKHALPVITYGDSINIRFNNDTLQVIHLGPGHTDGDSVVHWKKSNVIHMGDLFFKDRFPFIDLNSGGSVLGYRNNIDTILHTLPNDIKIIPGHGDLATKSELRAFKHMLDANINWMQQQLAQNKSLEDIHTAGVPQQYKEWGWRFISEKKWIDTLYQDLKP